VVAETSLHRSVAVRILFEAVHAFIDGTVVASRSAIPSPEFALALTGSNHRNRAFLETHN
jgi:hypothetical protein